jgi:hypothetical protein
MALILFRKTFNKRLARTSGYFICLGIGFMLIEIPLIQKFILYLGHPTLAFAWSVFALLIGGGIGSNISSLELWRIGKEKRHLAGLAVCLYAVILITVAPLIFRETFDLSVLVKGLISILLVLPLGFFMGMPFPFGI